MESAQKREFSDHLRRGNGPRTIWSQNRGGRSEITTTKENFQQEPLYTVDGRGGFAQNGPRNGFSMNPDRCRGGLSQNNGNFRSDRGGHRFREPSTRKPGNHWRTRVVLDENNWEEALKNLKYSMGAYKVVGFDVECINENNEEAMRRQEVKSKRIRAQSLNSPTTRRLKKERVRGRSSSSSSDVESPVHYDMACLDEKEEISRESDREIANDDPPAVFRPTLPTPFRQKRRPEVSVMIQFATYQGYAVLIRLCFLKKIPQSLRDFLADRSYLKVGVSIDDDAGRLLEDWNLRLKGWIDLRLLCAQAAMNGLINTTGSMKMGLKYMAERLFGSENAFPKNMNMKKMRSLAWSDWNAERLSRDQIQYACWDAQIAVDMFAHLTQRLLDLRRPDRNIDHRYFDYVRDDCEKHIEFPATSANQRDADDSEYEDSSGAATPEGVPCSSYSLQREREKAVIAGAIKLLEEEQKSSINQNIDHGQEDVDVVETSLQPEDAAIVAFGPIVLTLSNEKILVHPVQDGVFTLMIKNGQHNVLNMETLVLMADALKTLEKDANCRGVIITACRATSKCFSIGYDLAELITETGDYERLRLYLSVFLELLSVLITSRLSSVAVVSGIAVTGGSVLATFCDRRVISASGGVAFNEVKLGFTLPLCIIERLVNLMGFHKAEFALTSASCIDAKEAFQCGLANGILSDDAQQLPMAIRHIEELNENRDRLPETYKSFFNRHTVDELANKREEILDSMTNEIMSPKTQVILRKLGGKKYN